MGIPEELLDKVFEPFFTTKPVGSGTGLGLASVYGFVKQCDGHVEVRSEVGVGSTFTIELPGCEAQVDPVQRHLPDESEVETVTGARILFVEDEPVVRTSLCAALRKLGHDVVEVADGGAALEAMRSGREIDLVISDVLMPVIDGPTLARRMVEEGLDVPILFVSGYADGALVDRGVLREGVEFLHKPFSFRELQARVSAIVSRRGQ
jgi:two-component system cell cycle sensor histidine kinase/response regulator CckA